MSQDLFDVCAAIEAQVTELQGAVTAIETSQQTQTNFQPVLDAIADVRAQLSASPAVTAAPVGSVTAATAPVSTAAVAAVAAASGSNNGG